MKKSRITMFILTMILAVGMIGSSVFAATGSNPSVNRQNGEELGTSNDLDTRMSAVQTDGNVGIVNMYKEYTALNGSKFNDVDHFTYELTPVAAWDNSATDEDQQVGGATIRVENMPMPAAVANKVAVSGQKATITVPLGAAANGVRTGSLTDTVKIEFERPGRYIYKVEEIDKTRGDVTYDYHVYYLVFYVANKTANNERNGETQGGTWKDGDKTKSDDDSKLYVHTITAWRSGAAQGTNKNAEEITGSALYALIGQDDPAWNNAGNKQAGDNDANNDKEDTLGEKVGRSEPGTPNVIPVKFWNETESGDITVTKTVTGTLGDLNQKFEFTVELSGLQKGQSYEVTLRGAEAISGITNGKVTAADDGKATMVVKMKAKKSFSIAGLPKNATYKVTEKANDHKASASISGEGTYSICADPATASGDLYYDDNGVMKKLSGQPQQNVTYYTKSNPVIQTSGGTVANAATEADCAVTETVDATDGSVTVAFVNHRDIETETGIPNFVWPVAAAGILALIALAVVRRRKNVATVNDFEF